MSETRRHIHEEEFDVSPEQAFEILITPSAIRGWWGASKAIVLPQKGGHWAAAWGDEDEPDYISIFEIAEYDPPHRIVMNNGKYFAKAGPLPFEFAADASTTFTVDPNGDGSVLRVEQNGFPVDSIADEFYTACDIGWKNTFAGIRQFLENRNS